MRIRRLTITGFGPFKDEQIVDFTDFDADGLFLIAGETGVGKTSILDAIVYALYNRTPRWDNFSGTGASNSVRSDFCTLTDPTQVVVEFEANGTEYRVTRSPAYERKKARGTGTTPGSAAILVEAREGGDWIPKATKDAEAARLIESLIKLNKDEFLQVIMLAQGRFQEFLLANSDKRLELLSKIFGTRRFADYATLIGERRAALQKQLVTAGQRREALLASIDAPAELARPEPGAELSWLRAVEAGAAETVAAANTSSEQATQAEQRALESLDLARRQARRAAALAQAQALDAQRDEIDQARSRLTLAQRAERLRTLLTDASAKAEAVERAAAQVALARSAFASAPGHRELADDTLAAEVTRLDQELGALASALTAEDQLDGKERQRTTVAAETTALGLRITQLKAGIAELQTERAQTAPQAARLAATEAELDNAQRRLAAAERAAALSASLHQAQQTYATAEAQALAARSAAHQQLRRFLATQAADLAARLVPGEPCEVCGSPTHPAPAATDGEGITQANVDEAQQQADRLESVVRAKKEAVEELRVQIAAHAGAAGEADLADLTTAVARAEAAASAARTAARRLAQIDETLDADGGLVEQRAEAEAQQQANATQLAGLQAELRTLEAQVAAARGQYPSVRERQVATTELRAATSTLLAALAQHDNCAQQADGARNLLAARTLAEGFADGPAASAALLDPAATTGIEQQIEHFDAAVHATEGLLGSPDLQDLPEAVIAVPEAEAAHAAARQATQAATAAKTSAEARANALAGHRERLAVLLAETERLTARHTKLHALAETVNGRPPNTKAMSLESFYVAAELEQILGAANLRLRELANGQFELRHTERGVRRAGAVAGLEIEVFDEYTASARPANMLSGGQQFLASLALALGLADVVSQRSGGIELNTLFVDEGFGSLSAAYLEKAMATLDALKQGGRTVGVISHVASMQEQIPAQIRVAARPGGPSYIETRG